MEAIADRWAEVIKATDGSRRCVLNADDPVIADLGRDAEGSPREGIVYFGIDDDSQALEQFQHAFDAKHCRRCGHPYTYARAFVGHLGHYRCPNCGAERPRPQVSARKIELHGMGGSRVWIETPAGELDLELPLPGLYNVYNALAAIAAAIELGVAAELITKSLGSARAAFGRVETIEIADKTASILLIKNPAGANEVLRTLRLEAAEAELDLWFGLNDGIADGRDVSWIWDADFELLAGATRSVVCAGRRAPEMALRLKYAGFDRSAIVVVPEIGDSFDRALAAADRRLYALPTYTALLELHKLLAEQTGPEFGDGTVSASERQRGLIGSRKRANRGARPRHPCPPSPSAPLPGTTLSVGPIGRMLEVCGNRSPRARRGRSSSSAVEAGG